MPEKDSQKMIDPDHLKRLKELFKNISSSNNLEEEYEEINKNDICKNYEEE